MSINKRNFAHLTSRINLLDPPTVSRRELVFLINAALTDVEQLSLPADNQRVAIDAPDSDSLTGFLINDKITLSQLRHLFRENYLSLRERLVDIPHRSGPEHQPELIKVCRSLQSSVAGLKSLANEDIDSIHFQPFNQSEIGRKKLARAVASAHEQVGNKISEGRPIIEAEMVLAYRQLLDKYLDEQFPVVHQDDQRPKLSLRESLILAREFYESLESHSDLEATSSEIANFMVEGQNQFRFDMPPIEGIATASYWEQKIVEGFDNASQLETYEHLTFRHATLQDELPAQSVIRALEGAGKSSPFNPAFPVIHYLDDPHDSEAHDLLLSLGAEKDENRIVVFRDEHSRPTIATQHDLKTPDIVRIVRPGHSGMIVSAPGDTDSHADTAAADRLEKLKKASNALPKLETPSKTSEHIAHLTKTWRNLVSTTIPLDDIVLESRLMELGKQIDEVAHQIVTPMYAKAGSLDNAKELGKLLLMSGRYEQRSTRLDFRLPNGVGTHPTEEKPDVEIAFHVEGKAITAVEIKDLDGEQLELITDLNGNPNEAARKAAIKYGENVGIHNAGFPHGLVTYRLVDEGKEAISTGHWISDEERGKLTRMSPGELLATKVKGEPLFKPEDRRSQEDTIRMMGSAVAMIHGDAKPDPDLAMAGDLALSGIVLLEIDPDDQFGSEQFDAPELLYSHCTNEDIKRHHLQKITMSGLDDPTKETFCNRVSIGQWDQAGYRMDQAFEEVENLRAQAAPGM